jgi:hypothetical protein
MTRQSRYESRQTHRREPLSRQRCKHRSSALAGLGGSNDGPWRGRGRVLLRPFGVAERRFQHRPNHGVWGRNQSVRSHQSSALIVVVFGAAGCLDPAVTRIGPRSVPRRALGGQFQLVDDRFVRQTTLATPGNRSSIWAATSSAVMARPLALIPLSRSHHRSIISIM